MMTQMAENSTDACISLPRSSERLLNAPMVAIATKRTTFQLTVRSGEVDRMSASRVFVTISLHWIVGPESPAEATPRVIIFIPKMG
eukprot:151067-Amphidinium_carterae.1